MERFGKLAEMDRSFDVAYWQRLGPKAIFEAAWQMVIDVEAQKGNTGDLTLQRSVENLRREEVKYLVVGGHAVMFYSEPRYTKDLDIWIEACPENATSVFRALAIIGAPLARASEADFAAPGSFYQLGRHIDLHDADVLELGSEQAD